MTISECALQISLICSRETSEILLNLHLRWICVGTNIRKKLTAWIYKVLIYHFVQWYLLKQPTMTAKHLNKMKIQLVICSIDPFAGTVSQSFHFGSIERLIRFLVDFSSFLVFLSLLLYIPTSMSCVYQLNFVLVVSCSCRIPLNTMFHKIGSMTESTRPHT